MAGLGPFYIDAEKKAMRRNRTWYQTYIMKVLQDKKDKQVRDIDTTMAIAKKLLTVR